MTIFYLHGFNSDGGGWKTAALQKHFPAARVLSPDLPADPAQVMQLLEATLKDVELPVYLFGTSLGGFYALCLSARYELRAFLFNPSLQPHQTLHRGIGTWETFVKKRPYVFRPTYLSVLEQLTAEARLRLQPRLLHFFLATDDDILDLKPIPEQFPNAASIRWYDDCGHSFSLFEKALKEIRQEGWMGAEEG